MFKDEKSLPAKRLERPLQRDGGKGKGARPDGGGRLNFALFPLIAT